jgi:hypothetical protein
VREELLRYLHYDQVVPSYRHRLTVEALLSLARLERTHQLHRDDSVDYSSYTSPAFSRDVRLAAFQAMVMVMPLRVAEGQQGAISTVLTVVEEATAPGMAPKMLLHWARQVSHGVCSAGLFRGVTAECRNFMNRLWNFALAAPETYTRDAAIRLYRCIYGRGTPACASQSQAHASTHLHAAFARSAAAVASEPGLAARRVAKARQYLADVRRPREFAQQQRGQPAAAQRPAGAFKLSVKGGAVVSQQPQYAPPIVTELDNVDYA